MRFNLIHPSIIELYIDTLFLHLLQEKITNINIDELTDELNDEINEAATAFSLSANVAESLFGSSDLVQEQLDVFTSGMGDA
jgi:hypothetical protein